MRYLTAFLCLVWALANLLVAYLFVTNAFVAPTPHKEGFMSQLLLFLGGITIGLFSLGLARASLKLFGGESGGTAS